MGPGESLDKAQSADEDLRQALGTETRLFFESQIHEDHNALDLWTANYTLLMRGSRAITELPAYSETNPRKFTFPDNTRGGILGSRQLPDRYFHQRTARHL